MPNWAPIKYRQAKGRDTRLLIQKTSKNFQPRGKGHFFLARFVTNQVQATCSPGSWMCIGLKQS